VKRLVYPGVDTIPALFVNVIHEGSGRRVPFCMLLDTGASHTCIPEKFARFFGHDNSDKRVKPITAKGIGGESKGFEHTMAIELIDPEGRILSKLISPWKSAKVPVWFLANMDMEMGIIGRDIISCWKELTLRSTCTKTKLSWSIGITV